MEQLKYQAFSFHHLGICEGLLGIDFLKCRYVWKAVVQDHFSWLKQDLQSQTEHHTALLKIEDNNP